MVKSLEEAYELNQKKGSTILGGILWLKMSRRNIQTAIDLSDLDLHTIEETESEFRIDCMCTLRQLELWKELNDYFQNAIKDAVRHIVGTQFRNGATIGGSIFGRYGFSDVLTCLLALDTYVELYKGGIVSLQQFVEMPYNGDILVRIIIKKDNRKITYMSHRGAATDFPILSCAVAKKGQEWFVSVGARPTKACLEVKQYEVEKGNLELAATTIAMEVSEHMHYGSNMRGSAGYRQHLAKVFIKRAVLTLAKEELVGGVETC